MFNTLLRPSEIVYYSGISKEFPLCSFRTLFSVEEYEFNECLGIAFYDVLLNDLVEYSNVSAYNNNSFYVIGSTVLRDGVIYISIQDTQGNLPSNPEFWELAPKFTTDCYNELWCKYLAEYLSLRVIFDRIPHIHNQIKATGIIRLKGDSFETVGDTGVNSLQKSVLRSIERVFGNMHKYMSRNNENGCFDLYKGLAISCCGECGETKEQCSCDDCLDSTKDGYEYNFG